MEVDVRTVIIGGGPTGLFTAIALARRGRDVVVIDRDPGPPPVGPWNRRGVMQFHQAHTFRAPVVDALRVETPDVLRALVRAGATVSTADDGSAIALLCRRMVFEWVLRQDAEAEPGVTVVAGHVDQVLRERGRVVGVKVNGRILGAGLVIDASGRSSRVTRGLRDRGEGGPCGATYVSRQYRLRDGVRGPVNSPIGLSLSLAGYFAVVFIHDSGTFSITITHDGRDPRVRALRQSEVFEAVVREIPLLADWIDNNRSEPISPVLPGGQLYNGYRGQLDDGQLALPGLVAVGDAVCTTTPLAGRGVALAFQQVQQLVSTLSAHPGDVDAAATEFDLWCTEHIRPWFEDHQRCDTDRLRRWAGGDVDLSAPLPSDLIVAAAAADPGMRPAVTPYDRMQALPQSLDILQPAARAVYRKGWRPTVPAGPTREELGRLCELHDGLVSQPAGVPCGV
jgi:2-polyprenyl-6-methoxyphenol hydroxylase-like FAD-dependent oxidoreductase